MLDPAPPDSPSRKGKVEVPGKLIGRALLPPLAGYRGAGPETRKQRSSLMSFEVLAWMPGFHPLYRQAAPELLSFIDHHCGHGLFRNWAAFTRTVLAVVGTEELTKEGCR